MHKGEQIRTAAAPVESTRSQLEEIIKKNGKVDLFSLDSQHQPLPDERDLVKFCKLAEELGMDRTTLTRNLSPLVDAGLLETVRGKDARHRVIALTDEGRDRLAARCAS